MSDIIDFATYVAETNKQFEEATPAQKRVMIAQDVIARIEARLLIPNTGNFIDVLSSPEVKSLKDYLNDESSRCEVCAKGALFASIIGRTNKMTVYEFENTDRSGTEGCHNGKDDETDMNSINFSLTTRITDYFEPQQLDLIETAFEGQSFMHTGIDTMRAEEFYENYDYDPEYCLKAICQNIIDNEGEFIP